MPKRKRKKERGRPMENLYPPRIDATAEEIAQAMLAMPADAIGNTFSPSLKTVAWTASRPSTSPTRCTKTGVVRLAMPLSRCRPLKAVWLE